MNLKRLIIFNMILVMCVGVVVGLQPRENVKVLNDEEIYRIEHERSPEDTLTLQKIEVGLTKKEVLVVSCTVYNPVKSQCWGDPLITADGSKINVSSLEKGEIKWIAVSRDLLKQHGFKLGDKVRLSCEEEPRINGIWEIHDTMAARWSKKIDLLQPYGKGLRGCWSKVKIEKT